MIFTETKLRGAYVIDLERREDGRGFFARAFCHQELGALGLNTVIAQANIAHNPARGTVRGMHVQIPPLGETKLIRCTRGAVLDIIVDLRPESPSYLQHVAVELDQDNFRALYVPARFAQGYQVLVDHTDVSYQAGEIYSPPHERSLRYDDPRFGLTWPLAVTQISEKDRLAPLLDTWEERLKRELTIPTAAG